MNSKDTILAWLALLGILATGFISIRSEISNINREVVKNGVRIDSIHEYCCEGE
jgi:hypothetical protein